MPWKKLGNIFELKPINPDLISHCSNPLAIKLSGDVFRIFFSGRNIENKSSVGFFDYDLSKMTVTQTCSKAIFRFGDEGSFFSHGVSIGCHYKSNEQDYILFMGWQIRPGEHWRGDIGRLRLAKDKETLALDESFLISCDLEDKISLSYPWVFSANSEYKIWYGSTLDWTSKNGEMVHVIKYARSVNGENWEKCGISIPYEIGVAQAFSRPTVVQDKNGYHMWFSYRSGDGTPYRIGYAFSKDGLNWNRLSAGLDVGETGWDSEMICYPFVFDHEGKRYMLYNGNGYGKTGIGLAVMEEL